MSEPQNGHGTNKSLKKMATDAANSAFALQVNRLLVPTVLTALLGLTAWGLTTLLALRDDTTHIQAQQDYDSHRLTTIEALIVQKTAQRDAQFAAMDAKIDQNQQKDEDQFGLVNARISSMANDLAVLKCRVGKC